MASSFQNIFVFLITTVVYYLALHPKATSETFVNSSLRAAYDKNKMSSLAIYLVATLLLQFMVNASVLSSVCGGNLSANLGTAAIYTVAPWLFLFGSVLMILQWIPGFKAAFADVLGYYYVSGSASKLLGTLLKTDINTTGCKGLTELLLKIEGSPSLLINQITPETFEPTWNNLKPLMNNDAGTLKEDFFNLVQTRDMVGEACWFVYTGVLMTALVQLRLTSASCVKSAQALSDSAAAYQEEQAATTATTTQTYTLT
jgi:hypothetical protein